MTKGAILRAKAITDWSEASGTTDCDFLSFRDLNAAYSVTRWPKEQGALRRASMDLTRALAEMRKP